MAAVNVPSSAVLAVTLFMTKYVPSISIPLAVAEIVTSKGFVPPAPGTKVLVRIMLYKIIILFFSKTILMPCIYIFIILLLFFIIFLSYYLYKLDNIKFWYFFLHCIFPPSFSFNRQIYALFFCCALFFISHDNDYLSEQLSGILYFTRS